MPKNKKPTDKYKKEDPTPVLAPVRAEIPFDEEELVNTTIEEIEDIDTDRSEWLQNQVLLNELYEAKEDPSHDPIWPGAANYADPTTRTLTKTIYARVHRAIFSVEPFVEPLPIEPDDVPKLEAVRTWMNWRLCVNANGGDGAERAIAKWGWQFVKNGTAIIKVAPGKIERYVVERYPYYAKQKVKDPYTNAESYKQVKRYKTVKGNKVIWEGEYVKPVNKEDFYISPRYYDDDAIDAAPVVAQTTFVSSDYLRRRAKEGVWYDDVVEEILEGAPKRVEGKNPDIVKQASDAIAGVNQWHGNIEGDEHEILEVYKRWDLNNDGFEEEGIFWIHRASGKLLRWQFLEETYCDGKRPFVAAWYDFREDQFYVDGVPGELQGSQEEINFLRNQRVNHGTLASIPSGSYEPSIGMSPEKIKLEPGVFWPGLKINVLELPDHSAFGFREESLAKQNQKDLVGVGDIQMGSVAPSSTLFRTASGPASVIQEANIRYAISIKFFQWALRKLFHKVYMLSLKNAKPGMVLRVTGQGGYGQVLELTKDNIDSLSGKFDFIHRASSDTAFPSVEKEKAMLIMQTAMNPLLVQLGVVTPNNLYETAKEVLRKSGVDLVDRFLTKPQGSVEMPLPFERVIGRIYRDIPVKASPLDDFETNLQKAAEFILADPTYGLFTPEQAQMLNDWVNEEIGMQKQAQMAAMIKTQPQLQGQYGDLGTQSAGSSANDFMAAQEPQA